MSLTVITGAAGGIGSAAVRAFVETGRTVLAVDRIPMESSDLVSSEVADVTEYDELRAVASRYGAVDHVVTIAGGASVEEKNAIDTADLPIDVIRKTIDLNLVGAFITIKAFLPNLRAASGDRSITLTSATDFMTCYGFPAYAAAKAGLIGMVHSMAGVLGREGIRINAVAPGDIPTPRNARDWSGRPEWYGRIAADSALQRLCTVEEVAETFVSIAARLTGVTGQCIVVDAGRVGVHTLATMTDQ